MRHNQLTRKKETEDSRVDVIYHWNGSVLFRSVVFYED